LQGLCSECKGDSEKKIRARTEGCQPDVLGDDLVGAVTQVEVNEIGEAGHHSQHRQKTRTQESLVGKKNCLKYHNGWSEAGRRKGYL
jgi:hypothetical protein